MKQMTPLSNPTAPNSADASIPRLPSGVTWEGGFRLLGTPIGFSPSKGAALSFISHVDEVLPRAGARVLLSPPTAAAIGAEQRRLDTLSLGFDRSIRLGRMEIRIFPAGLGPGSAQLMVAYRGRRILFTSGFRTAKPLAAPDIAYPECDLLLIDIEPADPKPPAPSRVASQLWDWARQAGAVDGISLIVCGNRAAALEVAWILRDYPEPVRVSRGLYDMFSRMARIGYSVVPTRRLETRWPRRGIVIHGSTGWLEKVVPRRTVYAGPGRAVPAWASEGFRLGESEDRPGILAYVQRIGAREVAIGPRCDAGLEKLLLKGGIRPYRVSHPIQIPLPFADASS